MKALQSKLQLKMHPGLCMKQQNLAKLSEQDSGSHPKGMRAVCTIPHMCRNLAITTGIPISMITVGLIVAWHADVDVISIVSIAKQGLMPVL